MAQVASKTCDICKNAPERHLCIECEQRFCDNCKGLHTRKKATRQQKFQESSKMKENGKYKCTEHDEHYTFICNVCNVPVCIQCIVGIEGKHNGHSVFSINETISSLHTIVKDEIETTLQEDIRILNQLEQGVDTYDCQVKSVINGIREDEQKIKQMINETVKTMIDAVKMKTSCERDIMANLVAATKSRIETKTSLEDRWKHLEKERPNLAVIYDLQTLHSKI
ncbi:unnamed protein product [Mytilus coruscus]|uniref:B box-type domain-containing protein n=1 Tax=Mytilus coruscus TaxID=42192 RepID=A0A6J8AYM7_MYTCO|nr:unnamed protein product [Mytilus coruscus]